MFDYFSAELKIKTKRVYLGQDLKGHSVYGGKFQFISLKSAKCNFCFNNSFSAYILCLQAEGATDVNGCDAKVAHSIQRMTEVSITHYCKLTAY